MGALAVKRFVELHAHRPRIKWMNDVFVNDQKIAGVLATGQSQGDYVDLHLGVGLNIGTAPWDATCLQDINPGNV